MMPNIPRLKFKDSNHFFIMAGPCAIEGEDIAFEIAEKLNAISNRLEIPWIFKGSYRKANRSRVDSFTGIGDLEALRILKQVGDYYQVPTVTDIHEAHEAAMAAEYVDVLQIPAFLFRQTELLVAAAKTGKFVNIKKGQFSAASAMKHAAQKVVDSGNHNILLTDRGNMFGYQDMVVDFRNITWMKQHGYPVIMDITHSLQQPNQETGVTGGLPDMIETIAKAAIATGADGLFIETHPRPKEAKSDGANMLQIDLLEPMLERLLKIRKAII
ncbi:MAG: 3-deoxy-8-phosphooctulonate synthase [Bacteroidetes bacterium]|nr:3-deoxy-8-phosphooctulonate synthase [Bacteroidota bacterium]